MSSQVPVFWRGCLIEVCSACHSNNAFCICPLGPFNVKTLSHCTYLTKKWKELTNTSFAVLFPLTKWKALAKTASYLCHWKTKRTDKALIVFELLKDKKLPKPYCTCNIAKWKELIKMRKVKKNTSFDALLTATETEKLNGWKIFYDTQSFWQ